MSKSGGKALFAVGVVLIIIVFIWGRVGFYASSLPAMILLVAGGVTLMAVGSRINKGADPNKAAAWTPTASVPAAEQADAAPVVATPAVTAQALVTPALPAPASASSVVAAPVAAPATPWALLAADGSRYPIVGASTVIGRNPGADGTAQLIALPGANSSVSKAHAMLTVQGGEVRVRDLGSTNGTFVVDGSGVEQQCGADHDMVIPVGSSLELGEYSLALVAGDAR